jgi:hypothetical protein
MVLSFKNPRTFVMHVGEDILVNGKDINAKIHDAIKMYDASNY